MPHLLQLVTNSPAGILTFLEPLILWHRIRRFHELRSVIRNFWRRRSWFSSLPISIIRFWWAAEVLTPLLPADSSLPAPLVSENHFVVMTSIHWRISQNSPYPSTRRTCWTCGRYIAGTFSWVEEPGIIKFVAEFVREFVLENVIHVLFDVFTENE